MTISAKKFIAKFFDEYADKAHINNASCQHVADNCAVWFWNHLTADEMNMLSSTRQTALRDKKQQKNFFRACRAVRKALVIRGVLK